MEDQKPRGPRKNGGYRRGGDRDYKGKGSVKGGSFKKRFDSKGDSDRSRRSFGDKPRRSFDHSDRNSDRGDRRERKPYGDKPRRSDGDRSKRSFGDKPRRSFDRDSRGGRRSFGDRKSSFSDRREQNDRSDEVRKITIPKDVSKILFKGVDFMNSGDNRSAMIMFLHGSVLLSEGCENNALRILYDLDDESISSLRREIKGDCSDDAMIEFDYLCLTLDGNHDRSFFDSKYDERSNHAIFRKICLEEIEGDDPVLDEFASMYPDDKEKVSKGLKIESRKKDSPKAEEHLKRIDDAIELKRHVYTLFRRSVNGDAAAVKELESLSDKVPEAALFADFLKAKSEGNGMEWVRSKYDQYKDIIISEQVNFGLSDTPFGMYLKAKNLESKKEEYMSVMMNAARAGSQEAIDDLYTNIRRSDVKKCLASIHLKNGDLDNLMIVYRMGLDDMYYLDQYCGGDHEKIIAVGNEFGKQSVNKEIDWLKTHQCNDELISKSSDEMYQCKAMVYALHDIGADMEAAKLYFLMEGDPELPSIKWLKKVCATDEVREFVRKHYEDKGDTETFDFIFEEDGYEHKPRRDVPKKKSFGGRGRR